MIEHRSEVGPDGVSTLRHYVLTLWRRKWLALAPLVLLPLVTLVSTLRQPDLYEASADVLVNRQEAATTSIIGQTPAFDDFGRTADTQALLAATTPVVERVLRAENLRMPVQTFVGNSKVEVFADVLRFTVSDGDPARAARLASAYARAFVGYRRELDTKGLALARSKLTAQLRQLEKAGQVDSPLYVRLADSERQLESLEALTTSNVTVAQEARADDADQVAPRPLRNTALAAAFGLVLGLVLVALWETLSTKPRSEEEIEGLLGMPLLGRVRVGGRGAASPLPLLDDPGGHVADGFHGLRTGLELAKASVGARTIMVASLHAGEGASPTTANLALALARSGRRVAVVDLDLRSGSVTRLFGLEAAPGATTLARGDCDLGEALCPIALDDAEGRLEVVPSGPPPSHTAGPLGSRTLAGALDELARLADIVLLHVPPVLEAPDAAALGARLPGLGLLLVVGARQARGPMLADARRALETWPVAKLGFALTEGRPARPLSHSPRNAEQPARRTLAEPERAA